MFLLIFQCVLVVMCINCQLHVQLQLNLLLLFSSVSVLNGWGHMCVHNDMHATEFPCMRSPTLLAMSSLCQLLGWIFNLYGCSFIRECMLRPLLYLLWMQLILLSIQLLFFLEFPLQYMQLLLYFSLCLCAIFMSHRHLIALVSNVSFITSGSD